MASYEVRNTRSRMVLGTVSVQEPEQVLDALLTETCSTMEDLALSLGKTAEEAAAALDIVEVRDAVPPPARGRAKGRIAKTMPPRRWSFYQEREAG